MSKIIKNTTGSAIAISDTGATIPASPGQYTIPPQEYPLWAASDDVVVHIGTADLVVNDGSVDLGISDGMNLVKGLFPKRITITDIVSGDDAEVSTKTSGKKGLEVVAEVPENVSIDVNPADYLACPFGRLRVTNPLNIFEWKFGHGVPPILFDEKLTGSATGVLESNNTSYKLSTSTAINDEAIVSSRRYVRYAPGKGLLFFISGNFHDFQTGVTKCIGAYDEKDGIFVMLKDSIAYVVSRSNVTGTPVNTEIAQSNWNMDTFDGSSDANNPSGIQIDFTKQQLLTMDYQWLGSGQVRLGFQFEGKILYAHTFYTENALEVPYSTSGNAPIRAEILNHGTPSSAGELHLTCCAAIRDGGNDLVVSNIPINTGTTEITIGSTFTHIATVRMDPTNNRYSIVPGLFEIIMTSGTKFLQYEILHNATLGSPTWTSAGFITEYALGTDISSVSGGNAITGGHINVGGSTTTSGAEGGGAFHLGRDIDANSDTLTLVARTPSGTAKIVFNGILEEEL